MENDFEAKLKILRQLGMWLRTYKEGFDFTIATKRIEWFNELLDALGLAHEDIATSRAVLRRKSWWKKLVAYLKNQDRSSFELVCVGRGAGLVAEDFMRDGKIMTDESVHITSVSIAPTQAQLNFRESIR